MVAEATQKALEARAGGGQGSRLPRGQPAPTASFLPPSDRGHRSLQAEPGPSPDGRTQGARRPSFSQLSRTTPSNPPPPREAPLHACSLTQHTKGCSGSGLRTRECWPPLPASRLTCCRTRADLGAPPRSSPRASTRVHGQQGSLGRPTAPGRARPACRGAPPPARPSQQGWGAAGVEGGQTSRGRAGSPEDSFTQEAVHTHQTGA